MAEGIAAQQIAADKIAVDAELVNYHVARVEHVAGDARLAVDAARSMNVAGGAFGLMCASLVPVAMATTFAATEALASIEQLLHRSTTVLRAGVGDFTAHENAVIDVLRALASDVEHVR